MKPSACPDREVLSAYVLGKLPAEASDQVAAHTETCPACQAVLTGLDTAADSLIRSLRQPAAPAAPELATLLQQAADLGIGGVGKSIASQAGTVAGMPAASSDITSLLAPAQGPDELGRL